MDIMIKVMHIITGLNTGGAEMMLYKLVSGIDRSKFASSVVSLIDRGTLGGQIEAAGIPVEALGMSSGTLSPRYVTALAGIIRREQPDVIQGWMYHANMMASAAAMLTFKKFPVVWNIRQSLYSLAYEKKRTAVVIKAGAYLSGLPRRIVYNSMTGADQHEAIGYLTCKRFVISNGFDTDIFSPSRESYYSLRAELQLPADAFIIGLVGRFHPMKDHATFLKGAAILHRKYPAVHFVLAGRDVDRHNQELLQQISGSIMDDRIHLIGERRDTPQITAAFDIATSSSFTEGFPNVVGEAMSCAVPCVVTDVGDSAWIVGDTGTVVAPRDPDALAGAWSDLIEAGSEWRQELGRRARQRICDNFSLGAVVRQYEDLYAGAVAARQVS